LQVDFYHLTRDPAEMLVPTLAEKCLGSNERLLLVSDDEEQCAELSKSLWTNDNSSFLAHEFVGSEQQSSQPILISDNCEALNKAKYVLLADGLWRDEALSFNRVFFLFTADNITGARDAWRVLSTKEDVVPRYWKQDNSRWIAGP